VQLISRADGGQRLTQPRPGSGQQDPDAVLALRRERSGDDLVRGVIAAHGVDRDNGTGGAEAGARPGIRTAVPGVVRPGIPRVAAASVRLGVRGGLSTDDALAPPGRRPPTRAVRCRVQQVTGGARAGMGSQSVVCPSTRACGGPHYGPGEEYGLTWTRRTMQKGQ